MYVYIYVQICVCIYIHIGKDGYSDLARYPLLLAYVIDSGRGTTRADDAQGTPALSHI